MKAAIIYASDNNIRAQNLIEVNTLEDLQAIADREHHRLVINFNADPDEYIESKTLRQPFQRKKNPARLLGITVYDYFLE